MALTFEVLSGMTGEVADRLLYAAEPALNQMRRELDAYFAIPTRVNVAMSPSGGCSRRSAPHRTGYTMETTADYARSYAALRARYTQQTRAANPGIAEPQLRSALTRMLQHMDTARQRLSWLFAQGRTAYLSTVSGRTGGTLISWEYKPSRVGGSGELRVNPFTWYAQSGRNPGEYVQSLREGSPGALLAVGPAVALLHESDHITGCMFSGAVSTSTCRNIFVVDVAEAATTRDIDAAVGMDRSIAQMGVYQNASPRFRSVLGSDNAAISYNSHPEWPNPTDHEYVRWPTASELQRGVQP